jgi:cystathionine beta-lyase family protein involved in aluminum resistance
MAHSRFSGPVPFIFSGRGLICSCVCRVARRIGTHIISEVLEGIKPLTDGDVQTIGLPGDSLKELLGLE